MNDAEERGQICPLCCLIVAEGRNRAVYQLKEFGHVLMQLLLLLWSSILALAMGAIRIIEYVFAKQRPTKLPRVSLEREEVASLADLTPAEESVRSECEQVIDLLESDLKWRRGDPESKWHRLQEAIQIRNDHCKNLAIRAEHRDRWQQMHDQLEQREGHLQWLADHGRASEQDLRQLDQVREERRNLGLRIHAEQNLW